MRSKGVARVSGLAFATLLTLGAATAQAHDSGAVLGAAIGGAAGAAVGHSIGYDRGDVVIWSALGGAAGAAIGSSMGRERETVIYRPAYVEERYVVVRPPRRVVYVYEEPPFPPGAWHGHRHKHWKRGWERDRGRDWD